LTGSRPCDDNRKYISITNGNDKNLLIPLHKERKTNARIGVQEGKVVRKGTPTRNLSACDQPLCHSHERGDPARRESDAEAPRKESPLISVIFSYF